MVKIKLKTFPSPWPSQSQRIFNRLSQSVPTVLISMPPAPMMNSLKTVAEALIGLLTMLLQFLIYQLEVQPEGQEDPPEVMQTMESMVRELQNQRSLLQSLMSSSGAQRPRGPISSGATTGAVASSSPMPRTPPALPLAVPTDPNNLPVSSQRVTQALQRQALANAPENTAILTTRVSNWQVLAESEEEEVILDVEGRRLDVSPSTVRAASVLGTLGPNTSPQMTVGEWRQCRITWGKKHKGHTYAQVLRSDPGYFQWSLARFQSLPPNQQDFVKFCQVQLDLDLHAI
jgi:hypothetical protein